MSDPTRRAWRAGPVTMVLVGLFAITAGLVIPTLAYLIYQAEQTPWIPGLLVLLTVLALLYAWRFGLHPRLRATDGQRRGRQSVPPAQLRMGRHHADRSG